MSVVYDAGVLIAAERNNRAVWVDHRVRLELGLVPVTTAPVVAQVSRSSRQARLRHFLRGCDVVPFGAGDAHEVGTLLSAARTADVVDGHVVLVAARAGLAVFTSDEGDLTRLAARISPKVRVRPL